MCSLIPDGLRSDFIHINVLSLLKVAECGVWGGHFNYSPPLTICVYEATETSFQRAFLDLRYELGFSLKLN